MKLEAARAAGANHVVNSATGNAAEQLMDLTGGGAGAVIDLVGAPATAKLGLEVARKGGKYIVVGLYGGNISLSLPELPLRHLAVRGSYVGRLDAMHELIELVRGGNVNLVPVETRPLDRINETLDDLRNGRIVGRVVAVP